MTTAQGGTRRWVVLGDGKAYCSFDTKEEADKIAVMYGSKGDPKNRTTQACEKIKWTVADRG